MKTKNFFKWLCCSAILLIACVQTMDAGTKRIYFKDQTWWSKDGAASAVHYWGGSATGTTWPGKRMTKVSGTSNIWYYDIPDNVGNFCFVRVNGSGTIADWGAKTGDLSFNSTNNLYTLSTTEAWNGTAAGGEWSKYAPNGAMLGGWNSWDPATDQFSNGSVTIHLDKGDYAFKVLYESTYYGRTTDITRDNCTNAEMKNNEDNCTIKADVAGDYIFTWDNNNRKITVTYPAIVWQLAGFDDWSHPITFVNGSCEVTLTAQTYTQGTDNGFKLIKNGEYFGNNGTMTRNNCSNWEFKSDNDYKNCGITADVAGTYTFTINTSGSNPQLSVTYPATTTREVYLDLSEYTDWEADNATFQVWDNNDNHDMTKVSDCDSHVYKATVNVIETKYSFKRIKNGGIDKELKTILTSEQNAYKVKGWDTGEATTFTPTTYQISFAAGGGSGEMSAITGITCGASQKITTNGFTAPEGKIFDNWKDGNGTTYADGATITNIKANITLTAQWKEALYTISVVSSNSTYGTVGGSSVQAGALTSVQLPTATKKSDEYKFVEWTATDGITITNSTSATEATIKATKAGTVTANFALAATYDLSVEAGTGISEVGGGKTGQISPDFTSTITAVVKNGFNNPQWSKKSGEGDVAFSNETYTHPNASATATVTGGSVAVIVNATEIMSSLTAGANEIGTSVDYSVTGASDIGVETTATLVASTPGTGYKFEGWTLDNCTRTDNNGDKSLTITVKGTGNGESATATANYAEDLSTPWTLNIGIQNEAFSHVPFVKESGSSTGSVAYATIELQNGKTYKFNYYTGTSDNPTYKGPNNESEMPEKAQWTFTGSALATFSTSIAGTYKFKIDYSGNNPTAIYYKPSVNALNSNFSGSWGRTNGTVTGGVLTVEYNLQESEIKDGLEFEMIYEGTYYGPTEDGHSITPDSKDAWDLVAGQGHHVGFKPSIAGTYTFVFDSGTKKLTYTYPTLPAATTTTTDARYFGDDAMDSFIGGKGTVDAPYLVYTDEKITITTTTLEAQDHLTAMYQFGEDEASATELTKTIEVTSTEKKSIEVKAFYQVTGYNAKGETTAKTIWYQGVATPQLHLTASWNEKEENAVADNEQVTIYYSTTNYEGAATVTRSKDGADPVAFMNIGSGKQAQETYTLENKNVQRQTFVATAEVNGRTFTATTSVSVYRLVKITVTDAANLMDHYYMWIQDSNPIQYEQAWPGKNFFSTLGNAHIFYVKYPSYTHFVLNNGKNASEEGAAQTIDIVVPDQSTCYTIGEKITAEGADNGKYAVTPGECPNKLFVGDIADVEMYNGEGKLVQPQVDTDPDLDVANLNISVAFGTPNIVTYDQRGTGFMLTALSKGNTTATVTYSIAGATNETKTFNVTVGEAITIQAKIANNLGWDSHENIWINYWGSDNNHQYTQMKYVKTVDVTPEEAKGGETKQAYYTGRLPMPDGDSQIRFQIGYPYEESWYDAWRKTPDAGEEASQSGCYTVYYVAGEYANRGISRDGDNCFVDYQVEIDMNSGISYFSNKVDNNTDIVSFFAPGSNKSGYEGGSVRIMKNGEQSAIIPTETFTTSGVYTAKISGDGTGLTDVALYTGDYYIRTDAATTTTSGTDFSDGWNDYVQDNHKFTQFSLYPGAKYDYYWVTNSKRTGSDDTHFNVKGCVGNEYNPDLANMIAVNDYTDENGNIVQDKSNGVNLRFGYNPQTNYFERAILKGAGDNYFLNIQGDNIYNDEDCTNQVLNEANYNAHPEYSKFNDVSDWVYEKLIFAKIDGTHPFAQVVLKSKSFNDKIMYQLGYEVDEHGRATKTPIQKVVMGNGTEQEIYTLRVIYDYKTNRLSATWEPSGEIDKVMQVDADILFVSNEGHDVKEITFTRDSMDARLTSLQSVMYVLEIENNDDEKTTTPDAQYWIALPFECKISDIFGIENYITLDENRIAQSGWWGIMRYRGDLRAQKGWFEEDTPEGFWEWMYPTETLVPGEGYVLYVEKSSLSWNSITVEEPCEEGDDGCVDGKKSVSKFVKRFYFPSLVEGFTMSKTSEATSKITYPNQPCNITSPKDRRAEDSNWKVIAPKSYNNVTIKSADSQDSGHTLEGPNFIYEYNEHAEKGSRYTPTAAEGFKFHAFHGYMAQYGGTITWNPYSKTEHPTSAPRFAEEPSFKGGMLTIELVQNNEQLDRTFVNLSKNGTEGFDQNLDLTKITESCSQIASVSENVVYAGNTLPLNTELVPLNVKVTAKGTYDIALSESLNGLEVNLYDAFEQTTTPLDMMSATFMLDKGEYKDRFFLQLKQKGSDTPTSFDGKLEQYNLPTDKTQKLLINGNIYLINGGRVYNATGVQLR